MNRFRGPDLLISNKKIKKTVEVKLVSKRKNRNDMIVSSVKEKRKNDDFVCYITRDDKFYIDTMATHNQFGWKSGERNVTALYYAGGFLPVPKEEAIDSGR